MNSNLVPGEKKYAPFGFMYLFFESMIFKKNCPENCNNCKIEAIVHLIRKKRLDFDEILELGYQIFNEKELMISEEQFEERLRRKQRRRRNSMKKIIKKIKYTIE